MNRKSVFYRGSWLDPNSQAWKLHEEKKFKELDAHMAKLDKKAKALEAGDTAEYARLQ
jgi:hypothetical protein